MAVVVNSVSIPVVGKTVEVAAAAGTKREEECNGDVMKLTEMLPKLNPSAKEFAPASCMPASELLPANGGGNSWRSGRTSSERLLTDASDSMVSSGRWGDGRRNSDHYSRNDSNQGSNRIYQQWGAKVESIKRTVHVTDIDGSVAEEKIATTFQICGKVLDIRVCGDPNDLLRSAFIEFENEDGARTALTLEGTIIGFFPIKVFPSKTAILPINPAFLPQSEDEQEKVSRTIYCTNIDRKVTHEEVKDFFESYCGQVARSRVLGNHSRLTRVAFVEFNQAESAITALNCSGMFLGAIPIRVSPSRTPVRTPIDDKPT